MADQTFYLSPHLDDAALSCGGQIALGGRQGEAVTILTVFSADEPADLSGFPLASMFHRAFGRQSGVVAERRQEDEACCQRLGARTVHWQLLDSIYRSDSSTGEPLYRELRSLFGPVHPIDQELIESLSDRLREETAGARVVAPLAVGDHVDHRIVRYAAERAVGSSLHYYEDFPYVTKWRALRRKVPRHDRSWRSRVIHLAEEDVAKKIAALACFDSQKRLLGKASKLGRKVERYTRKVGGERLWTRQLDPPQGTDQPQLTG